MSQSCFLACAIYPGTVLQDGGVFLAAVDEANEHCISLWDWNKGEKGQRITETKVHSSTDVLGSPFSSDMIEV